MLEIYGPDGLRKFWTEHKQCFPPVARLREMQAAGYKIRVDGKRVKL